jgi:hypothetical protein
MAEQTIVKAYRGPAASLPTLEAGQLGFTTDTEILYVGDGATNHAILMASQATAAGLALLDDANAAAQLVTLLGATSATAAELNVLDGITATVAELNITDGVTATAAELNALDGITSTVTELNYTDGVTSLIQTQLDDKEPVGIASRFTVIECDCPMTNVFPLSGTGVASGTLSMDTAVVNHPGILLFVSSTTTNSGYWVGGSATALLIGGGEMFECVFNVIATTDTTVRLGWTDSAVVTEPVDGVWISIIGTQLDGYAKNNTGPTITATHYHITDGVWYRCKIVLNADATLATFTLYTCANGVSVWSDTVNDDIPTGAGRQTTQKMIATNSGTTAISLLDLDWWRYSCSRALVR